MDTPFCEDVLLPGRWWPERAVPFARARPQFLHRFTKQVADADLPRMAGGPPLSQMATYGYDDDDDDDDDDDEDEDDDDDDNDDD